MSNTYVRASSQTGLTDSDIIDIRVMAEKDTLTASQIGEIYNIDRTTAARIISGRTWSHVPAPKARGNYVIYPDGRVFSKAGRRFMSPVLGRDGLAYVEIRDSGNREKVSVVSLVAKAFLNTRSKKIKFVNGDTTDTHFTNLVVSK